MSTQARTSCEAALERLEQASLLNAHTWTSPDWVRLEADAIDRLQGMNKDAGPLAGVPIAVKESFAVHGMPHQCGSAILDGLLAKGTSRAVYQLQNAGAVVLCGANMDELAIGTTGRSSVHGATLNPRAMDLSPGGSSSGSAALVAAGVVPLALGSDSGGSVRLPASHCGVVGMIATQGRISRSGLMAHASSLDRVGVLTRDVAGAALAIECLSGRDDADASTADRAIPPLAGAVTRGVKGLKIGLLSQTLSMSSPVVADAISAVAGRLSAAGAKVVELSLPDLPLALPCYSVLSAAEASSNLARLDGMRFGRDSQDSAQGAAARARSFQEALVDARSAGLGPDVRLRLMLGGYVLSEQGRARIWEPAVALRAHIRLSLFALLGRVDVLLMPTAPNPAWSFELGADPQADAFSCLANLAGLPAISVPCGSTGPSIGAQVVGRLWDEAAVLAVGASISGQTPG